MTPDRIEELTAGYVLGNLSPEETEEFEQLLAKQPQLQQDVDLLHETRELIPYALPEVAPPSGLRDAILDKIEPAISPIPTRSRRRFWLTGIGAIAAVVTIALGLENYNLRRQLAQKSPLPHNNTIVSSEVLETNGWNGVTRLVNDHLSSLDREGGPVDFVSASAIEIADRFAPQFRFDRAAPQLTRQVKQGEIQLLGGSFCKLGKIKGIRFTYRIGNERLISLYQLEASERDAFPLSGSDRLYIQSALGPSTIVWNQDDILYAVVSELPPRELQEVAANIQ